MEWDDEDRDDEDDLAWRAVWDRLGVVMPDDMGGDDDRLVWNEPAEEPPPRPGLNVVLSAHAERQMVELGAAAEEALGYLRSMSHEEISWTAESLPSQRGREIWLLWAGAVRILFDIEDDDLCVQGFGLSPRRGRR